MNIALAPERITRRKMTDRESLDLQTLYYPYAVPGLPFEACIFNLMKQLCAEYTGGSWEYYVLSNGAWYLAPTEPGPYRLKDVGGRAHAMSGDGAGLTVTLYLVNHLSWHFHSEGQLAKSTAAADHYHALRMYTYPHVDAGSIWKVLD